LAKAQLATNGKWGGFMEAGAIFTVGTGSIGGSPQGSIFI